MGLFSSIALLPLAPVRGVAWVAQQVADEAERQLYDESRIRRELLQLELDHDAGVISDEERDVRADELLKRLAGPRDGLTGSRDEEPVLMDDASPEVHRG
jgi:Gas vesicle protein G